MAPLMPQLMLKDAHIRKTFAELQVTSKNRARYSELVGHPHVQDIAAEIGKPIPTGYRLLMVTTRLGADKFEIALVCDAIEEVVYYNQVIIVHYVDLNCRPATQQLIWRSNDYEHQDVLSGLAAAVFFDYVLKRYDVIMSDNTQTGDGKAFWERSLSQAIARNLHAYHYQLMTAHLTKIRDKEHLRCLKDQIWGEDDEYKESLAIISCRPLPLDIKISND